MNGNVKSSESRGYSLQFALLLPILNCFIVYFFYIEAPVIALLSILLISGGVFYTYVQFRERCKYLVVGFLIFINISSITYTITLYMNPNKYKVEHEFLVKYSKQNLKQLNLKIRVYFDRNNDLYPENLLELAASEDLRFRHPHGDRTYSFLEILEGHGDYIYLLHEGFKLGNPDRIVFVEKPGLWKSNIEAKYKIVYVITEDGTIREGRGSTVEEVINSVKSYLDSL